jgi:hypothetical protein
VAQGEGDVALVLDEQDGVGHAAHMLLEPFTVHLLRGRGGIRDITEDGG